VVNAPFDILLGRPFLTLAQVALSTYHDNEEDITVTCPNSGRSRTIPTHVSVGRTYKPRARGNAHSGFQTAGI
jgi:hypothetical protein